MSGKRSLHAAFIVSMLAAVMLLITPVPVQGAEPGSYLVTVRPSYRDPETGKIEDPGNNEAIGQGMTEKLCGSTGLLEIDGSGNTWLTVRYYLSQFVKDVSFEERSKGSFLSLSFQDTQTKLPDGGAADIDAKYGYTDYRIAVGSMASVFRGKAYIEPMGRSVVYFFTVSNPVPGSGDFVTALGGRPEQEKAGTAERPAGGEAEAASRGEESILPEEARLLPNEAGKENGQEDFEESTDLLEGGAIDDPVTGIPAKPGSGPAAAAASSGRGGEAAIEGRGGEDYHLHSGYDLSDVPLDKARRLTKPIIESAVGITAVTGTVNGEPAGAAFGVTRTRGNQLIMWALLAASAILAACFGFAAVRRSLMRRRRAARPGLLTGQDGLLTENRETADDRPQTQRDRPQTQKAE